jgi:hypothetical protein
MQRIGSVLDFSSFLYLLACYFITARSSNIIGMRSSTTLVEAGWKFSDEALQIRDKSTDPKRKWSLCQHVAWTGLVHDF